MGRTQTNCAADYVRVHEFEDGLTAKSPSFAGTTGGNRAGDVEVTTCAWRERRQHRFVYPRSGNGQDAGCLPGYGPKGWNDGLHGRARRTARRRDEPTRV